MTPEEAAEIQASLAQQQAALAEMRDELTNQQKIRDEAQAKAIEVALVIKALLSEMNANALAMAEHYRSLAGRKPRTPREAVPEAVGEAEGEPDGAEPTEPRGRRGRRARAEQEAPPEG